MVPDTKLYASYNQVLTQLKIEGSNSEEIPSSKVFSFLNSQWTADAEFLVKFREDIGPKCQPELMRGNVTNHPIVDDLVGFKYSLSRGQSCILGRICNLRANNTSKR